MGVAISSSSVTLSYNTSNINDHGVTTGYMCAHSLEEVVVMMTMMVMMVMEDGRLDGGRTWNATSVHQRI